MSVGIPALADLLTPARHPVRLSAWRCCGRSRSIAYHCGRRPRRRPSRIGAISLQSGLRRPRRPVSRAGSSGDSARGSPVRFEDRVGDNHHHLICRICGRVVDVDCAVGGAPCLTASDGRGYEIDEAEVAYWCRCPQCMAKSRPARPTNHPHADPARPARRRRKHNQTAKSRR